MPALRAQRRKCGERRPVFQSSARDSSESCPKRLLQLGNIAFDRGDAAQALDIVQRYLAVNAPTPEILWLGFRAQRKLGDTVEAAVFARRVQTEFPDSEQAQNMRNGVDR